MNGTASGTRSKVNRARMGMSVLLTSISRPRESLGLYQRSHSAR